MSSGLPRIAAARAHSAAPELELQSYKINFAYDVDATSSSRDESLDTNFAMQNGWSNDISQMDPKLGIADPLQRYPMPFPTLVLDLTTPDHVARHLGEIESRSHPQVAPFLSMLSPGTPPEPIPSMTPKAVQTHTYRLLASPPQNVSFQTTNTTPPESFVGWHARHNTPPSSLGDSAATQARIPASCK
ncbi:hypothetical protein CCUS01_08099 [Colletotrichum cuscutae]|uniref:Uncharacterized protein n=1 Tax=Colletotrichum cuscutae TaxID=1209917 RepID=A0AAI9UU30_9PEZI|nr:hypothetical protein CCUS01_08099 [Colletotrichum cuscutae]